MTGGAHPHPRVPAGADGPVVEFAAVAGRRSSIEAGRTVVAAAAAAVDPALAARVRAEPDWRHGYPRHLRDLLVASVQAADGGLASARAGLAAVDVALVEVRNGGERSLEEAVRARPAHPLVTARVEGEGSRPEGLTVPLGRELLSGDALLRQVDRWAAGGVLEQGAAEALRSVVAHPEWLDLRDCGVALLGAGAELSPLPELLSWGATVQAVDLPVEGTWERLGRAARRSAGRLLVPVRAASAGTAGTGDAEAPSVVRAGADLLREGAAVRRWLGESDPGLPLAVVGDHVHAPGAAFLRVAAVVDAVVAALLHARPDTVAAGLATPTDVYAVPPEAVADARRRAASSRWRRAARTASAGRAFRPAYERTVRAADGRELGLCDAVLVQQGPGYAAAKWLQRWRALVRARDGGRVSTHVAPPARTRSVTANPVLAAAYRGAPRFGVQVFEPATGRVVMAALLVADLRGAVGGTPAGLADLHADGAVHGGLWRLPDEPRSVLGLAVALGFLSPRRASRGEVATR